MYLKKLNNAWSAFLEAHGIDEKIVITNTTKLNPFAGLYMLEFQYGDTVYHLYHTLNHTRYELRTLDETYAYSSFEAVFDINEDKSNAIMDVINQFMLQNYNGIQTSVDGSQGLEQAQKAIQKVRLFHR